jgi:hypothetical protein
MSSTSSIFINSTVITETISSEIPSYIGFITLAISVVFYGSFFLPVKKYETGDGMFFQLILCIGIWSTAFVINWIRNFPRFYALPMICGLLWSSM